MHNRSHIQLNHVQLVVKTGFASKVSAHADTGIDRQRIHRAARAADGLPELLNAFVSSKIRLDTLHLDSKTLEILRSVVDALAAGIHQQIVSMLGKHSGQLVSNAARRPGNHSKLLCSSTHNRLRLVLWFRFETCGGDPEVVGKKLR